jgi:hypothetical protein
MLCPWDKEECIGDHDERCRAQCQTEWSLRNAIAMEEFNQSWSVNVRTNEASARRNS